MMRPWPESGIARQGGAGHVESEVEVLVDPGPPLGVAEASELATEVIGPDLAHAGIVDQDVEAAVPGGRGFDQRGRFGRIDQVVDVGADFDAFFGQLGRAIMDALGGRRDRHPRPLPPERPSGREPDPVGAAAAGYQRGPAAQVGKARSLAIAHGLQLSPARPRSAPRGRIPPGRSPSQTQIQ